MAPPGPPRALNPPRPRPAQAHWDRSHLCRPRPSHLCRPRPRGHTSPPPPLPPIKAGQSASVPLPSGDARLGMLRERWSERYRRSGSGVAAGAAWGPRCSGGKIRSRTDAGTEPGTATPAVAIAGLGSHRGWVIEARLSPGSDRHRCRGEEPLRYGCYRTEPGAAPPAAASAGRGSRRGRMIEVGWGPGPDRHRYRRRFPGAAPGSRLETGRAGEWPVAAPGPPGPRRSLSAAARPAGRPLADTAPLLSPAGTPSPARQRRGHRAPQYRDTALPCESHSARIPPLRVRILGGSPPNDRGWGRCSRCGCARCGPGGGQKPPKRWQPSRPLGSAGGAVPAACRTHVPVWAPGYRDSAGTDTAEALPVAPQPGAALNRHTEIPQPGQTPPTAQKDPKEQRALPGVETRTVCRGAQTAVPVSDLPELPHSSQILNPKQYT
ncbi:nascent polypeptide-associated complex subunit alpha, muscle-specific form-like [Ammospiza nelsoni]|uniref:nascent polypeptide-associated complex subunit alpha, muscle-specific form-like n=1 Tax=Ammospiza nelsoni TaxID=2857394 RepID=UPI00286985EB|nr:nascent polypeptide-associated complex subunit alpha, muscle-specific form-like [Ammospiza nelsoni]XP_059321987.1 nascent polypeptide-associated complex subunit alpha, muscle-specific form-like [Ammospiza nelsoni]XP_059321988.1 nascent polypeptide-associated complex subunit alpha, muscle-specific form-like [Ammospiza nelsoni]